MPAEYCIAAAPVPCQRTAEATSSSWGRTNDSWRYAYSHSLWRSAAVAEADSYHNGHAGQSHLLSRSAKRFKSPCSSSKQPCDQAEPFARSCMRWSPGQPQRMQRISVKRCLKARNATKGGVESSVASCCGCGDPALREDGPQAACVPTAPAASSCGAGHAKQAQLHFFPFGQGRRSARA